MRSSVVQSSSSSTVKAQGQSHASQSQSRSPYPSQPQPRQPSRVARRRSLVLVPAEGWLALVLLAVAIYCVNFVITAATRVDHTVILNWNATIGLVVGLIVAKVRRLPQPLLHLVACLAGFWLSVWLVSAFALHVSWLVLIANLEAVIANPAHLDINSTVFLFYLSFLCFFLGYFGVWLVYRAHLPWLVAIVYCAILIVNLRYISHDLSYVLAIALVALILLIARVQLSARLMQWKSEGLCTDRQWLQSITSRFIRAASLIAMCALLISWMLPIFSEPSSGVMFWNYLENAWSNTLEGHISWQEPGSAFLPYQQPATNFFGDQLTLPGSVKLPTGEVLFYTSTAAPQYLMGSTFDRFDGHTWTSLGSTNSVSYNAIVELPNDGTSHYTSVKTWVTIVQPPGETNHYLFAPAQPSVFNVPTTLYVSTTLDGTPVVSAWAQQSSLSKGERYQVGSLMPNPTSKALSAIPLPQDDGSNVWKKNNNYRTLQAYYVQVPLNLSPQVEKTTRQWTEHATNAYEALHMLEAHLSDTSQFTYSQDNPIVPGNVDAVSWLLQTHRGYCTYYATAMTIMARQLGIPARIVDGFSSGHYDAHRKIWVVNGTDAHSWVQAYFPEIGWLNFDPTPGYTLHGDGTASPKPRLVVTPQPTSPVSKATPLARKKASRSSPPSEPAVNSDTVGPENMLLDLSMLMVLLSLVIFVLALLWRWWSNLYADRPIATRTFWRLCCIASLVGLTPRAWQTPYEYGRRLCQQIPQEAIPLWHLTELFVRERWAGPHQLSLQTDLKQVWPGLRRIFWLLLLVRLRKK